MFGFQWEIYHFTVMFSIVGLGGWGWLKAPEQDGCMCDQSQITLQCLPTYTLVLLKMGQQLGSELINTLLNQCFFNIAAQACEAWLLRGSSSYGSSYFSRERHLIMSLCLTMLKRTRCKRLLCLLLVWLKPLVNLFNIPNQIKSVFLLWSIFHTDGFSRVIKDDWWVSSIMWEKTNACFMHVLKVLSTITCVVLDK